MSRSPLGAPLTWGLPGFPHEPREPAVLREVPGALLTRVQRGPLRTIQVPTRWHRGAVYDADLRLVPESQKIGGLGGNQAVQADPLQVRRAQARGVETLSGTWLYGGHWIGHFGHFATETVPTLWPERSALGPVRGVLFHHYMSAGACPEESWAPWQRTLLDLTGWGDLPVRVVAPESLGVERLLVPSRPIVVNGWAHPEAARVWARMTAAAGGATSLVADGPRVYLSRTAFNDAERTAGREARTTADRDRALDAGFAALGFTVVAPETLPLLDQVRLVAGASVIAGCAGTALHLSAFAPPGVRVLELGDARSPGEQVPMQRVIDQVCGHPSAFVPHATDPADLPALLADLG